MNVVRAFPAASTGIEVISQITEQAQDIAHVAADYQQAQGHRRESLKQTISSKLDSLLGILLRTFSGTATARELDALLREHHPLTETRLEKLAVTNSAAVPLIVMRELMSVHKMPVDRKALSNWSLFAQRYHYFV